MVVLLWGTFVLLSPLVGRIGCGWVCFMGTVQDLAGGHRLRGHSGAPARRWVRALWVAAFLGSAAVFFVVNLRSGLIPGWRFAPTRLSPVFDGHYKQVWLYDTLGAVAFALFLNKRWLCRACPMGTLCALGARHSRLLPVLEASACNGCRACERECPVAIPILEGAARHKGLVVDGDCLNCGRCQEVCSRSCVKMLFVWDRSRVAPPRPSAEVA